MVAGGTTDTSARFTVKVDNGPAAVRYDTDSGFSSPTTSSSEAVDSDGVATIEVTGLTAGTRYHWQTVDNGTPDTGTTGQFLTHPVAVDSAASFRFGFGSCAGSTPMFPGDAGGELDPPRLSNHPVFDTIREQALAEDWLYFVHLGDLHYYDFGDRNTDSIANRRTSYDDVLSQSGQAQLYREVPWIYLWDDHDFGPNNSDGTYVDKTNAAQVYRERVPHHDLAEATGPIYHSVQVGRVLIVLWDIRYDRSPNGDTDDASKGMLGSDQVSWFDTLLAGTSAELLIIVNATHGWNRSASNNQDSWRAFTTERAELVSIVDDRSFTGKTVMLQADHHSSGLATEAANPFGDWPIMMCVPLDSRSTNPLAASVHDLGGRAVRGAYGVVDVRDTGDEIAVTLTAYVMGRPWANYTYNGESSPIGAGNPSHVLGL